MYFYRIMTKKEFINRKNISNIRNYEDCVNTHNYDKGGCYIHLFLNAESCFEDFSTLNYKDCVIGCFDIPDEIIDKYKIGLGGYNPAYTHFCKRVTISTGKNYAGGYHLWLPEIAIHESDFNYDWCITCIPACDSMGNINLPRMFQTEDHIYENIIFDGILLNFNNERDLLKKYNQKYCSKQKVKK